MAIIEKTAVRVNVHSPRTVNERIRREAERRLEGYPRLSAEELRVRLDELDREWDIERWLEADASSLGLVSMALGRLVDRRFYALGGVILGFLFQHALQGWCPPVSILRRRGVRTAREIDDEREVARRCLRAAETGTDYRW